ncbi:MAG: histidine triad nucleotide-binding protein [Dehalococcoidia bacterium]|nr:histidine triad nucleotide-binding protein [Dehalococcoidia bacterium]
MPEAHDAAPYDPDNVFARILRGELPSDRVYEDDECIAFRDVAPAAPTHILVIPRRAGPVSTVGLAEQDAGWVGRLVVRAARIAAEQGLAERGYRLVLNAGPDAGQAVPHLHVHILGGGELGPFA